MKIDNQIKIEHLFMRAGFGATPAQVKEFGKKSPDKALKSLLNNSEKITPLVVVDNEYKEVIKKKALKTLLELKGASADEIKEKLKEAREKISELNYLWINRMASGEGMLREKMTLFWHGHFACRGRRPLTVQIQHNVMRENALGKFGDLLLAISKDPDMLQFLNNQQNKKNSPNENFAREVMELFTLGRGNYTENDVKEAARAFTGWSSNLQGEFVFRPNQHDDGQKTFQGKTGNFKGEDVLNIILQNPQTSTFICTKIFRYFVNEVVDNQLIEKMSKRFRSTDYDIADLMEYVFKSDWFYNQENIGTRIKSPVELLVGLQRNFGIDFQQKQAVLFIQKSLGQVLFYPPNVAGWSGGKNWIDSSTLMTRMKLPEIIFKDSEINIRLKDDGDVNTENLSKKLNRMQAVINWSAFQNEFSDENSQIVLNKLESYLLPRALSPQQKEFILKKVEGKTGIELLKMASQSIASLPEYQLC
ncbi:DUF1800 domain-containing protein [Arcicella sp. LKC2W]|uniref:DUF1800 domain-containing protein n=1 Tax=Arcicella sp. LKC2W TaxID=2984198 RepID=UPI002B200F6D|nr:DUF1800 domain-containing protein [Arcicella sp. LKC2W]MEA5461162.1 DUF1800 domain-containing protein [Arcicella sp. LKC2W]